MLNLYVARSFFFVLCVYIRHAIDRWLWNEQVGYYIARNVTNGASPILNRVYLMGMPLWAGLASAQVPLFVVANQCAHFTAF